MQEMSESFNETVINDLLKLCLEWLVKFEDKQFSQDFAEDIVSIMAHLFYRNEFQYLVHYTSDTSKLLVKILVNLKSYSFKWKRLRKIKAIIDRWGDTLPENCEFFPIIAKKFFDTYFDSRVFVKSKSKAIFNPMFPSRAYVRMFGVETSKKVLNILEKDLKVDADVNRSEKQLQEINEVLYKMSFLYSARIRLPDNDKVADLLFRLYQYHASSLPLIYNFRTWIIHYSNISKDNASYKVVSRLTGQISKEMEEFSKCVEGISIEDLLNPACVFNDEKIKGVLKNLKILVNSLELKYVKESYEYVIYSEVVNILQKLNVVVDALSLKAFKSLSVDKEANQRKLQSMELCKNKSLYEEFL